MTTSWTISVSRYRPGPAPKGARDPVHARFRAVLRKGGSGLGLTIAAELVRGHGGELETWNHGRKGTTFAYLPAPK